MRGLVCGIIIVLLAGRLAHAENMVSAYTLLELAKCRHIEGKAEEDYGEWRCIGYAGVNVLVSSGDQRIYVSFGRNAKNEPAARQTLASFNGETGQIEWRGTRNKDGKLRPFATIMRWSTTVSSGDEPVKGEMLVVTRLAPGRVCHVGYVDAKANSDAIALAHKIADEQARKFRCRTDKPIVLGNKGPGFSGPYDN